MKGEETECQLCFSLRGIYAEAECVSQFEDLRQIECVAACGV